MKFFIVALMLIVTKDADPIAYTFTNPTFDSIEKCKIHSKENIEVLMLKLYSEFGDDYKPMMVSCVDEDVVNQLWEMQNVITF